MYFVKKEGSVIKVCGPAGWVREFPARAVIVQEDDCHGGRFARSVSELTDAELVQYALDHKDED